MCDEAGESTLESDSDSTRGFIAGDDSFPTVMDSPLPGVFVLVVVLAPAEASEGGAVEAPEASKGMTGATARDSSAL